MFTTKRKIEALEKELQNRIEFFKKAGLQLMEDSLGMLLRIQALERIQVLERKQVENYIPCSTCKCLIRKEDAIKGKSEIVRNDIMTSESCGDKKYGTFIEELVTPYYCHNKNCKHKK